MRGGPSRTPRAGPLDSIVEAEGFTVSYPERTMSPSTAPAAHRINRSVDTPHGFTNRLSPEEREAMGLPVRPFTNRLSPEERAAMGLDGPGGEIWELKERNKSGSDSSIETKSEKGPDGHSVHVVDAPSSSGSGSPKASTGGNFDHEEVPLTPSTVHMVSECGSTTHLNRVRS